MTPSALWILTLALIVDAALGDPPALWRRVPHPVVLIGGLISLMERWFNRPRIPPIIRRLLGVVAVVVLVVVMAGLGWLVETIAAQFTYGWVVITLVVAVMLAGRSLFDHVRAVQTAFWDGVEAARKAIAGVVGRNPGSLDEPRICRAAIETTAENMSDGLIAPALFYVVFGLPGLLAYKAVNTADSMIGHRSDRFAAFGWAAARLDDGFNIIPSRLTALLLCLASPLAGGSIGRTFTIMRRDAGTHRSPNAGWPEAAMAGALDVALAGPRRYGERLVDDPYLNQDGRMAAESGDIGRALKVFVGAGVVFVALVVIAALVADRL
ncbi:MAG: adenosylcobinamide-phosphate synthase CbiB [Alphaproteobacteria bacterium]